MNTPKENFTEPQFELSVDGEQWKRIINIDSSGPDDQIYTLDRETGSVRFGDGVHGKIPPTGSSVRAEYRYGGGSKGNTDNGTTITLNWTSGVFQKTQIIGALVVCQSDGVNFQVSREQDDSRRQKIIMTISDLIMASNTYGRKCKQLTLGDLALSVMPWPFHKDLPAMYCGKKPKMSFGDLLRLVFCNQVQTNYWQEENAPQYTDENQSKNKTYTVRKGDTLASIAQDIYHDPGRWREIANANGIREPRRLTAGTILHVPPLDDSR